MRFTEVAGVVGGFGAAVRVVSMAADTPSGRKYGRSAIVRQWG